MGMSIKSFENHLYPSHVYAHRKFCRFVQLQTESICKVICRTRYILGLHITFVYRHLIILVFLEIHFLKAAIFYSEY